MWPYFRPSHRDLSRNAFHETAALQLFYHAHGLVFEQHIVRAALDNTGRRDQCDLRFLLELRNGERPAVAHGRFDLAERQRHIVLEGPRIGHIGVDPLLKGELLVAPFP